MLRQKIIEINYITEGTYCNRIFSSTSNSLNFKQSYFNNNIFTHRIQDSCHMAISNIQ